MTRLLSLLSLLGPCIGLMHPTARISHTRIISSKRLASIMESPPSPVSESGNVKLDGILNLRDLSSVSNKVKANKLIRTGCISKASENDIQYIRKDLGVKTFIDLRSKDELTDDEHINSNIYNGYKEYVFNKKLKSFVPKDGKEESGIDKKRYFVSLMSESLIKKSVFFGFRKRTRALVVGLLMLSNFSRRAEKNVRSLFIDRINDGGLSLLNEFVFKNSGHELANILKVIADSESQPVVMYCTAGKDRTGVIAMLVLHILGVSDEAIIQDYVKSDSAYADINDNKALVAGLKQVDVNPDIFLRAFPEVMRESLQFVRSKYGSVDAYLNLYGFDETWRRKLRLNMAAWKSDVFSGESSDRVISIVERNFNDTIIMKTCSSCVV